ncbi:hypothetical protein Pmani_030940 [Petrolisthes manimaculis]|uniref:Uncharacterized protein n=1 Tax=Petrolisthes manimaculis TaxID=1843537 RepID=A0AAE1TVD6_9EUCA|nr:hypothetical protein Pmani_030940 [Petrolisthes manimaculis]
MRWEEGKDDTPAPEDPCHLSPRHHPWHLSPRHPSPLAPPTQTPLSPTTQAPLAPLTFVPLTTWHLSHSGASHSLSPLTRKAHSP